MLLGLLIPITLLCFGWLYFNNWPGILSSGFVVWLGQVIIPTMVDLTIGGMFLKKKDRPPA